MNKSNKIKTNLERKGYKFRLIVPSQQIESKLAQYVGCCRKVWNIGLDLIKQDRQDYYDIVTMSKMNGGTADGITTSFKYNPYQELSAMLPKWKASP
jgi:hypothetical protein